MCLHVYMFTYFFLKFIYCCHLDSKLLLGVHVYVNGVCDGLGTHSGCIPASSTPPEPPARKWMDRWTCPVYTV